MHFSSTIVMAYVIISLGLSEETGNRLYNFRRIMEGQILLSCMTSIVDERNDVMDSS